MSRFGRRFAKQASRAVAGEPSTASLQRLPAIGRTSMVPYQAVVLRHHLHRLSRSAQSITSIRRSVPGLGERPVAHQQVAVPDRDRGGVAHVPQPVAVQAPAPGLRSPQPGSIDGASPCRSSVRWARSADSSTQRISIYFIGCLLRLRPQRPPVTPTTNGVGPDGQPGWTGSDRARARRRASSGRWAVAAARRFGGKGEVAPERSPDAITGPVIWLLPGGAWPPPGRRPGRSAIAPSRGRRAVGAARRR